ncbi:hypothetical protein HW115_18585 [Verrucomicrobiaceae bacterium N1E253]|uniref:Uncharacterized protein n=1 Tax=Oceaniferula marina TaxID=2748318 RepID=A0A851GP31_9BACT|nr:hypothetical protein [Oceaniferula marina]NWK57631.1 hypothetical protein [Oceaniferula marina]
MAGELYVLQKIMRSIIIVILAIFMFAIQGTHGSEEIRILKADEKGVVSLANVSDHIKALIAQIRKTDMNPWLLSEDKNAPWIITQVTIISDDLLIVKLCDGNGLESVIFDRNHEKEWVIIRRHPVGDWKPRSKRRGDRLTNLAFTKNKAEQDAAPNP